MGTTLCKSIYGRLRRDHLVYIYPWEVKEDQLL